MTVLSAHAWVQRSVACVWVCGNVVGVVRARDAAVTSVCVALCASDAASTAPPRPAVELGSASFVSAYERGVTVPGEHSWFRTVYCVTR